MTNKLRRFITREPAIPASTARDGVSEDSREWFEERAAIMEFDGGLSRQEAERLALAGLQQRRAGFSGNR